MAETIQVGRVNNIRVRASKEGVYLLTARTADDDSVGLLVTDEALRSLWAHLTKLLYPRAGDQLTERIETVKRVKEGVPADIAYSITAHTNASDGPIIVSGVTRDHLWTMEIDSDEGDNLWTILEDILDEV